MDYNDGPNHRQTNGTRGKLPQMIKDGWPGSVPNSVEQEHLVNHPMIDQPSSFPTAPPYDPAVSAELLRAIADAGREALVSLHGGADFAEQSIRRLAQLNRLLEISAADPDMIEMKQTLGKELKRRLQRFMREGSNVTEDTVVIQHTRQAEPYPGGYSTGYR